MKKYFLLLVFAVFMMSCSKTVNVEGKISSARPEERLEFVDVSSLTAFPVANFGVAKDGTVKGSFDAPHDGFYIMAFGGRQASVYLKRGETFKFSFDGMAFPAGLNVYGEGKNNNDFLTGVQQFVTSYSSKIQMKELLEKDENVFMKDIEKVQADLLKNIEEEDKKFNPSNAVVKFKKNEVIGSILGLMSQYESNHGRFIQDPNFKVSKTFKDYEKKIDADPDAMIKEQSVYRNYMLNKISEDYQHFAEKQSKNSQDLTNSEVFAKYLDTRKDLSQTVKDYLLANVMTQFDMNMGVDRKDEGKYTKIIDGKIKDSQLKQDLKKMLFILVGLKDGTSADPTGLVKADGQAFQFAKGKPTVLMFYAGWNAHLKDSAIPVVKEVVNFYKSKMDFAFVSFDDTKEDFKKSTALFAGIPGTQVYAEGGLKSKFAENWAVYSFKLPSFIVIDKEGKIASKLFGNLGDQDLIDIMDKLTGLKAPTTAPAATLQNDLFGGQAQPAPQPSK